MNFRLSDEAERIIRSYVNEVDKKIDELGFEVDSQLRKDMLFNVEHHLRYASFKRSWKRRTIFVEAEDALHVVTKFASPEKLVRETLLNPKTFPYFKRLKLKRLNAIKARLGESSISWLLDAGCGWGRTLFECERHGIRGDFVGVDIDRVSVRYGRSIGPTLHWIVADIQGTLPFKDVVFDAIICRAVLHETRKSKGSQEAIREFARVLKPEGLLHITDTFVRFRILTNILSILRRLTKKLERFYPVSHIENALKQNKFRELKIEKILSKRLGCMYAIVAILGER